MPPPRSPSIVPEGAEPRTLSWRTGRAVAVSAALLALVGLLICSLVETILVADARRTAKEIASDTAEQIELHLLEDLAVTHTLAAFVRQSRGHFPDFEAVARDLLSAHRGVSALELAPAGVIQRIVPLAGNEKALGHDLLADPTRDKEARLAVDTGQLTLAGPFMLRQGGKAMVGRLPVFLPDADGKKHFWGFAIAVIRMPDFLRAVRIDRLQELGYAFELGRSHPDTGALDVLTGSPRPLTHAAERVEVEVPNGHWHLDIAPVRGWHTGRRIAMEAAFILFLALLGGGVSYRLARNREALERSEKKYRQLVTTTREGIVQVDADQRITFANDTMAQLLGYASGETVTGMHLEDFVFPEDMDSHRRQMARRKQGERALYERRLKRQDGKECWCLISSSPLADNEGRFAGSIALITDCNEHKQTQEALKSLNRDFVTLLENTTDFIYFKDREGRYRFCSQALARTAGYQHWRDLIGKGDLEIFPQDTAQMYYAEELPIYREGKPILDKIAPYYDECRMAGWVSTNKWPVFSDDGESVVGLFGINRVVTQRVRAEAQLLAANKELQGFIYAASHDLKAPLGRINSFSTLLERNYREHLEGDGLLFLDFIRRNAMRMSVLIEDLLAHAQIEQQALDLQAIELRTMIQAIIDEGEEEVGRDGAEIRLCLPETTVHAHPTALSQVLRNLLENALKYRSPTRPTVVEVDGRVQDGRCRLWIRDNGIGFDMAYHDRIFEIFRRLHTYEEYPGSGIGLALVKKAMERMGGRVWAESCPGEGATFYLELRARQPQDGDPAGREPWKPFSPGALQASCPAAKAR